MTDQNKTHGVPTKAVRESSAYLWLERRYGPSVTDKLVAEIIAAHAADEVLAVDGREAYYAAMLQNGLIHINEVRRERARLAAAGEPSPVARADDREALSNLYRAYVNLLEAGRDRILALGGQCDPVDVMERSDPALIETRARLADAPTSLPRRDPCKPAEAQGLFNKFTVTRTDSSDLPGGKHHGCRYYVLDVDHDQHARAALTAYAQACEQTHPQLAQDLREKWGADAPTVSAMVPEQWHGGAGLLWDVYAFGKWQKRIVSPLSWDAHAVYLDMQRAGYSKDIELRLVSSSNNANPAAPTPPTSATLPEQVTDGGRNMFYEGRFDGESERQQKARLYWANDMRAAFERHTGNGWFDRDWQKETGLWASCWQMATAPTPTSAADAVRIRSNTADAITGALAFGAQGNNMPPADHWLRPFWDMARADAGKRVYTYLDQPTDNVPCWRLGEACSKAAASPGGDYIDTGLGLLKELQAKGFGVVEIDAAITASKETT